MWSPDGARVAFSSVREGTDNTDIFVKTLGAEGPPTRVVSLPGYEELHQWPRDDLLLFEHIDGRGVGDLWRVEPTEGARPVAYLPAEEDLDDPVLSPDGELLAYQSQVSGVEEVYLRSFPDPEQPVAVSEGPGQYPRWSPDGGTLYYWLEQGTPFPDTLVAARIGREPAAVLSREVVLTGKFSVEDWDLHPDGDRIIIARDGGNVEEEPEELRFLVVVNWFEELRSRLGKGGRR